MKCEKPHHKEHVKDFAKKYHTAVKNGEFPIITVNPEGWAVSLEDPKVNTMECCLVCSISENIIRASSRRNEPDRYRSCRREQV